MVYSVGAMPKVFSYIFFRPLFCLQKRGQVERINDRVSPLEAALTLIHWRKCTAERTHPDLASLVDPLYRKR